MKKVLLTFPNFAPNNSIRPQNPTISSLAIKTLKPLPKPQIQNPNFSMAPLPLKLKFKPQNLTLTSLRPFSSSSTPPFPDPNPNPNPEIDDSPQSPKSPSSSLFSDIKERLRSPTPPPRRIPDNPPLPPPLSSQSPSPSASFEEIRKHLAEFRRRSSNPNANPNPSPSQDRPISFEELFKSNAPQSTNAQNPKFRTQGGRNSIRESLRQFRPSLRDPPRIGLKPAPSGPSLIGDHENLPESIFGREMREKMGEKEGAGEEKALKTEFVKMYSYEELGEKLKRLRPEAAEKGDKDWFSLDELNLRLAKLRELEDEELKSRMTSFSDLRMSLMRLTDVENTKISNMQRRSILTTIGMSTTPSFMFKEPQEHLLENYFHPDHMSSAEKMKLELKKVRDEFKMSESDCGSARVQVAQLTTKIKHLSSVLHKKDKHSRKGLSEMVQRRKKLLKYLRRTDWDSYCFVLSKLGLRDVPEYKVPDYKC